MLWMILYFLVGVTIASFAAGVLWQRVGTSRRRIRLLSACAIIAVAWPGALLLAYADKSLTSHDYLFRWIFKDVEDGVSE